MDNITQSETLDLEILESRLEMESMAALAQPLAADTTPITICHF